MVTHVRDDRTGALSRQLGKAMCEAFECAPRSSAYTKNRPDFAKARRNGVEGIVFGAVTGKASSRVLWLALFTRSKDPDRTWTLPLRAKGLVSASALSDVVREVEARLAPPRARPPAVTPPPAVAAPPPAPPPPAPEVAAPIPSPEPPAPPPAAEPKPERAEAAAPIAPRPAPPVARPPAEPPDAAPAPPWAALELGVRVTGRELDYTGTTPAGTSPLSTMSASAIVIPGARLELYPLAPLTRGALAGLGLFGGYDRSVGFEVKGATQTQSAELTRISAGLGWRLPPLTGLRLVFSPAVSFERRDLVVKGGIAGLPDAHLQGVKGGLGLAVPVASWLSLLLDGSYVQWTSSKDLVKGDVPFFPSGSAAAIELEAGLSVAFSARLSLKVLGEYGSTSYSLDPDPTGTYRASGATDRFLGGRAALRLEL